MQNLELRYPLQKKTVEAMEWIPKIDTILIGGGGIRGIALVGALEVLEEYNKSKGTSMLATLQNTGGASIGSIFAYLLANRMSLSKMRELFLSHVWNMLYQQISVADIYSSFGLIDSQKRLLHVIHELFPDQEQETFADLFQRTHISLTVQVTNITTGQLELHNDKLTPHLKVIPSIMASCSIPFIFTPVLIEQQYYIDGAILAPFPVPQHVDLQRTIAFCFEGTSTSFLFRQPSFKGFFNYMTDILYLVLNHSEAVFMKQLPNEFRSHIVHLQFADVKSWDFHLSQDKRLELVEHGRQSMLRFLNAPLIIVNDLLAAFIADYCAPAKCTSTGESLP